MGDNILPPTVLGVKGSISAFEAGVIRARMVDAAPATARCVELPIGHVWHRDMRLGLDPDIRLRAAGDPVADLGCRRCDP